MKLTKDGATKELSNEKLIAMLLADGWVAEVAKVAEEPTQEEAPKRGKRKNDN